MKAVARQQSEPGRSTPLARSIDRLASAFDHQVIQRKASCVCGGECPRCLEKSLGIQTKLAISTPGDAFEQEADRVSEQILRMPDSAQAARIRGLENAASHSSNVSSDLSSNVGAGMPLDAASRSYFEPRFGHDFGHVRVHAGPRAAAAAASVQARAFTIGRDVVFAAGEHNPESEVGKRLLAHELTHVLQQGRRSTASKVLQRQAAPRPSKPEIKFRIGWLTDEGIPVETNGQVAAIARVVIANLREDLGELESDSVKAQVTEWIDTVTGVLPYFDAHASEKVDSGVVPLINHQYDELVQVRAAVHQDKLIQIKEALWREHDAAVEAAKEAEALQPALDDALRAAYRRGSNSTVKDVVSTVKGALSIGRALRQLAADITTDIMRLPLASGTKIYVDHWTSQIGKPKITIINVGKYTDKLGKLGRGLSALNVVLTIADRSKKATSAEQGMKDLSDAVNIGTDLISASPLAAPPHFSLYSTLYLKPALKVISKQLGVLVENLSDINRVAVAATGDLMYPNAEPGGQEMFDLMVKVMHAEDESELPALPGGVKEYLFEHREKLSTGAEAAVPTRGSLFWKELDSAAGRRWLFTNRQRVWAMFYGSMKVQDGKR
jgi:hypothetical protein